MVQNGVIRVGPAGWSYEDWQGIVYSKAMRMKPLELLSVLFDVVEVNSTFYRPVSSHVSHQWCRQVMGNPRFRFTVKVWRKFTHEIGTTVSRNERELFLSGLQPLLEKNLMGVLLAQFPWSFKRTRENRFRLGELVELFCGIPLAIEFRHASWDVEEVYAEFRKRNLCFCSIDQPILRDSISPTEEVTAPFAYIRLHGRNAENWFKEGAGRDQRYDYLYTEEELQPWVDRAQRFVQQVEDVYIITNNHYSGKAVVNALELQDMLGKERKHIPTELINKYPRLIKILSP